jgi:hypothetical protein
MALQLVLDVILKENGQPKFCSFLGVGLHCHQPKRLEIQLQPIQKAHFLAVLGLDAS